MTILLVRNAAKQDFGGAERYPVSLAKELQKQHIEPILITRSKKLLHYAKSQKVSTKKGWWWKKQNWNGKNVLLFPLYIVWQFLLFLWYIYLIKTTRATAIHLQSKDDFIAGSLAGKLTHCTVVWTDHMDLRYILKNTKKPLKNPLGKLVRWAMNYADHIILISDNEYSLVTRQIKRFSSIENKILVIKNGVIDQPITATRTSTEQPFTFCLASRVVKNKGISEAIAAFQELQKKSPQKVALAVYGDGDDLERYKQQARSIKNITFYGYQTEPLKRIAAADVYILPSYQEGFSIALLEASMLGKAIIASSVDSNPEIVQNKVTGLLVPPRDIKALKNAMGTMLENPVLRTKLEKAARDSYKRHFNLSTIVKRQIIPLYTKK